MQAADYFYLDWNLTSFQKYDRLILYVIANRFRIFVENLSYIIYFIRNYTMEIDI